jgi:hypothetical protein
MAPVWMIYFKILQVTGFHYKWFDFYLRKYLHVNRTVQKWIYGVWVLYFLVNPTKFLNKKYDY